jgi:hypothetical protein
MNTEDLKIDIEKQLKMKIDNFASYGDGISFTTETELEAYKAAYYYRFCKTVRVMKAEIPGWLVQVYHK